jgi:hypothetical protein
MRVLPYRFGVGLTVVWIVSTIIALTIADFRVARFLRYSAFEVCDYVNYHVCYCGNCWRGMMNAATVVDGPVINFTLIVVVPIGLAWLCAYVATKMLR